MLKESLFGCVLFAFILMIATPQAAHAGSDDELGGVNTTAAITPGDQTVNINGAKTVGGQSQNSNSKSKSKSKHPGAGSAPKSGPTKSGTKSTSYMDTEAYKNCAAALGGAASACIPRGQFTATTPAAPDGVEIQPITITDLATFAPAPATITGEPDNLGVAGLPTNFTTSAAAHTRSGELFGYPITVRFTPASFVFHYGDGDTKTTKTPGISWDAQHLPQFSPTDTSHAYRERGTYTASADTVYTAEIDLGTGWFPITGTLTIRGPGQDIRIYEAHTALVAHTCNEDPHAAGC